MLKLFARIFENLSVKKIEVTMKEKIMAMSICVRDLLRVDFDKMEKCMRENGFSFVGIMAENDYFKVTFVKDLEKEKEDC